MNEWALWMNERYEWMSAMNYWVFELMYRPKVIELAFNFCCSAVMLSFVVLLKNPYTVLLQQGFSTTVRSPTSVLLSFAMCCGHLPSFPLNLCLLCHGILKCKTNPWTNLIVLKSEICFFVASIYKYIKIYTHEILIIILV